MIIDYRGIPTMKKFDVPVVLDITHSLQQPNQSSGVTGGQPELIETVARAGIAVGADGLFIETHFDPANVITSYSIHYTKLYEGPQNPGRDAAILIGASGGEGLLDLVEPEEAMPALATVSINSG